MVPDCQSSHTGEGDVDSCDEISMDLDDEVLDFDRRLCIQSLLKPDVCQKAVCTSCLLSNRKLELVV